MKPRHRDGLLALVVTGGLLAVAWTSGLRATDLLRPTALVVGSAGALGLELLMARFPERSVELWERRSVRLGGSALVVGGASLTVTARSGVLVALLGGLATYFVLLTLVLSGVVPGPETWFSDE